MRSAGIPMTLLACVLAGCRGVPTSDTRAAVERPVSKSLREATVYRSDGSVTRSHAKRSPSPAKATPSLGANPATGGLSAVDLHDGAASPIELVVAESLDDEGARPPKGDDEPSEPPEDEAEDRRDDEPPVPQRLPAPDDADQADDESSLQLGEVVDSIYASYPLLESAYRERTIALGKQISAAGAFDTKLKGSSANQPTGFYRTYRQKLGVEQPLFSGGRVFSQYRIGRGFFEPWYLERQTNDGGEFKAGVVLPLLQNRRIDQRRAGLWQADFDRQAVEPSIRGQLIEFVRAGSFAYWEWVAAGRNVRIAERLLKNARDRVEALKERAEQGDIEEIAVTDNERLIVQRRAKLVDARRKLRQSAIKLSLFYRTPDGRPFVPGDDLLPEDFPAPEEFSDPEGEQHVQRALDARPELEFLQATRRRVEVELQQARNLVQPSLDAGLTASQDMGQPTSSKRDKSRFEVEAAVFLEVPLQRRKARGKVTTAEGKLAQLNAKYQFTEDKIAAEVRAAATALAAAYRRYEQTLRAAELAETMEQAERRAFELGASDLFRLNLREKQTAEAQADVVQALREYHQAEADFQAALGELQPVEE